MFNKGEVVEITNANLQSFGLIGIVTGITDSNALVYFEDWNGRGKKELCFKLSNIKSKGEAMMSIYGNYRVAIVKFIQGTNTRKEYAFALFDCNVNEDDFVLCDTTMGYNVAKVIRIIPKSEYQGCTVTKEIVCKVDFTNFNNRKKLREQKDKIKKQMDKMVRDNQELFLYQALAEKNPEMAALLEAYQALGNV